MGNSWYYSVLLLVGLICHTKGDLPGCFQSQDNATAPDCDTWIDANDGFPIFFPHQSNCSRYWECDQSLGEACLRECAPCGGQSECQGHKVLYFDDTIDHEHGGPTCIYPMYSNCNKTDRRCDVCEAWQTCEILDDGTVVCTPDCKLDVHCNEDEYCDFNEGGGGYCIIGCRIDSNCTVTPCSECVNHVCFDPECCKDDDCQGQWICEDGTCKPECVTDDDCESNEYCNTVEGICKVGCRDDAGCTSTACSSCVEHQCVDPECCIDQDCIDLNEDEPICKDYECIPGCRNDPMCPGFDQVCDPTYSNCNYCDNPDNDVGECKPGCIDNDNCAAGSECANHECVTVGTSVLRTIEFMTATCDGCTQSNDEPGITATLIGGNSINGKRNCTTNILDHDNKLDYGNGANTVFEGESDKDALGGCYLMPLQSKVTGGSVTWNGAGTWTPKDGKMMFFWSDSQALPWRCTLQPATLSPSSNFAQLQNCEEYLP